jgi:hypothetical protein
VLWLAPTTGGLRAWATLGFSRRLGAFPAPTGPAERLVTRGLEAARDARTHRLGGILALADISHVVALDARAGQGLGGQADLALQETQGGAAVYRNDAWRGPAMLLSAPPASPLSPGGLADVVRDPQRVPVTGWPFGRIVVDPPEAGGRDIDQGDIDQGDIDQVLYLASGVRGGVRFEPARGRLAAAGAYVPAAGLGGRFTVDPPGRAWRWLEPVQLALIAALLGAWFAAAYVGGPAPPLSELVPDTGPVAAPRWAMAAVPVVLVGAVVLGWAGPVWGVGGPFLSSAWYCPPIGEGFTQSVAVVNPNRDGVEYLVRPGLDAPPTASGRLEARSRSTIDVRPTEGAVVEAYGRRIAVAAQVGRQGSNDASLCAGSTSELNVFPEGGRFATLAQPRLFERYVIHNPFGEVARASVKFITPERSISPPDLQDVQVPPGEFAMIDPEQQDQPYQDLSAVVTVWQGRAVVARRLRTVEQVSWSLPTPLERSGILPRALTQDASTRVVAVNTSGEAARVAVFGAGRRGSIPEETFTVADGGRAVFDLTDVAPRAADLVVELEADRALALESVVAPDERGRGVSMMPPLTPQRAWVLPLAERRDLLVVNPNPRAVRVEVEPLGPGAPVQSFTVEPSRSRSVRLGGDRGFGLIVRSPDGPVTAAVVGGRGSMPGVPLS